MKKNNVIFDFPCSETFRKYEAELSGKKQEVIHQRKKVKPLDEIEFRKLIGKLKRNYYKRLKNKI